MMRKIKDWYYRRVHSFIGTRDLLEIRADFLELYKLVLRRPGIWKTVNKDIQYWYDMAIDTGARAEYFNPHKGVLRIFSIMAWVVGIASGTISYIVLDIPSAGSIIIVVTPVASLKSYCWLLSHDTKLYQLANKKLRFNRGELQQFKRNLDEIVAAAIWNGSLLNTKTIPALQLLRLTKLCSKRMYKNVIQLLKIYSPIYTPRQSTKKTLSDMIKWYAKNR